MSYILEALKKAQAERQLGSAPTIHALPIHAANDTDARARPWTVRIAIAGTVLAVAGIALVSWRQQPTAPASPAAALAPVPAAASPGMPPAAPPPQGAAPAAVPETPPLAAATPARPPAPAAPAPHAAAARSTPSHAVTHAVPPALASKPAPAPAPAAEDLPPTLRELPEAIQREVPQVAIGGYIYSKNPEDRLLLIDKVLRHEGEEVAPGLTLEKLLPKSAVMRYKAYRYRVPY